MKVTLIQCPLWGTLNPPIALAQLSACLKKEGHQVRVFDLNIKLYLKRSNEYSNVWAWEQSDFWYKPKLVDEYCVKNSDEINCYVEQVLKENVQLVGFSVSTASMYMSLDFAKRLKQRNKDIRIVFGGPLFFNNRYVNEILNHDAVDVVITGEGEYSICRLVECISKDADIVSVPGISFKKNSSVIRTQFSPSVNLDSLPFLDFTDLPLTDYDNPRSIGMMASRGCIRRCYFCSDAPCRPGYRAMSGERIFQEVVHQKKRYAIVQINFMDLAFNSNMGSLIKFCELMIKNSIDMCWHVNMLVRSELTKEIIEMIASAGCKHVIFGIESGSERILKMMNKHYNITDADRIIRQMHEAGICVTANFMFGFPGETEEDFVRTLDFLKRNFKFLDRCYPSRTYFALEEFSYVYDHPEEFNIKASSSCHHLFWESVDGENNYPFRMERCRRFCELALKLGIEVGEGVQTSVLQDEWFNLAHYYETRKEHPRVIENLLKYYELDQYNSLVNNRILYYKQQSDSRVLLLNADLIKKLTKASKDIVISFESYSVQSCVTRFKPKPSSALRKNVIENFKKFIETNEYNEQTSHLFSSKLRYLVEIMGDNPEKDFKDLMGEYIEILKMLSKKNSMLNDQEYKNKNIILSSSPKMFFLQLAGPCNSNCVFCSRGHDYQHFNLLEFKDRIESKIAPYLALAEQFVLTGSGEFLRLKEWREILNYFEKKYPYIEKMFSTNGSSLRPEVVDLITSHKSRYSIHVSLHASNTSMHKIVTRMDNFGLIVDQIKYLLERRKQNNNVVIDLFFVATTLNIEDLPNFVHLAKELGVDSIIVNYNYIYVPAQKYLSCYFKPDLTNRIFDESAGLARDLDMRMCLPPKFNVNEYPALGICREPWSQIMFNEHGHVLPCDVSHDCNLRLEDTGSFNEIWNSEYYIKMRKDLVETGYTQCYDHCHRANPSRINLFSSHVIHRGKERRKIDEFWEDNF